MSKKNFVIALLLLSGLTTSAQGIWSTGELEADELKGQAAEAYYSYEVAGEGSFVFWDWDDFLFKINTDKGVFDVWYYEQTGDRYIRILLGLYDLNGKLVEKLNTELRADVSGRSAWILKQGMYSPTTRKKIKKMKHALKSGEGYVRVLCDRKSAPEFDLKVMPYIAQE